MSDNRKPYEWLEHIDDVYDMVRMGEREDRLEQAGKICDSLRGPMVLWHNRWLVLYMVTVVAGCIGFTIGALTP